MGAVYVAEHPVIGRRVAIKVLHSKFAQDPDVVTRFFNEAKAANAIRHPGIGKRAQTMTARLPAITSVGPSWVSGLP